jgi:hypothetical protein
VFRIVTFEDAEKAHAPLNAIRLREQALQDVNTQGRRITVSNLPTTCDGPRLQAMLKSHNITLASEPVVILSKYSPNSCVAFLTLHTEHMAYTAILEAPGMSMSGRTLSIRPTQPKVGRSLHALDANEAQRMAVLGPSDGMSATQLTALHATLRDAAAGTLADLRRQFLIDEQGTFANQIANVFCIKLTEIQTALSAQLTAQHQATIDEVSSLRSAIIASTEAADQRELRSAESISLLTQQLATTLRMLTEAATESARLSTIQNNHVNLHSATLRASCSKPQWQLPTPLEVTRNWLLSQTRMTVQKIPMTTQAVTSHSKLLTLPAQLLKTS